MAFPMHHKGILYPGRARSRRPQAPTHGLSVAPARDRASTPSDWAPSKVHQLSSQSHCDLFREALWWRPPPSLDPAHAVCRVFCPRPGPGRRWPWSHPDLLWAEVWRSLFCKLPRGLPAERSTTSNGQPDPHRGQRRYQPQRREAGCPTTVPFRGPLRESEDFPELFARRKGPAAFSSRSMTQDRQAGASLKPSVIVVSGSVCSCQRLHGGFLYGSLGGCRQRAIEPSPRASPGWPTSLPGALILTTAGTGHPSRKPILGRPRSWSGLPTVLPFKRIGLGSGEEARRGTGARSSPARVPLPGVGALWINQPVEHVGPGRIGGDNHAVGSLRAGHRIPLIGSDHTDGIA